MEYFIWNKGDKTPFSKNFSSVEFECNCSYTDCVEQKMSKSLIAKLQTVREEVNFPLKITSAFRCRKYQAHLSKSGLQTAKGTSTHELGHAVDVKPAVSTTVHFKEMFIALEEQFMAIGDASPKFVHCDLRSDVKRRWKYN